MCARWRNTAGSNTGSIASPGIQAGAAEHADARLAEQRAEKLAELELLIDATMTTFAHQLRSGSVRVAPVDLPRLFKLREELWAQTAANTARRAAHVATQLTDDDTESRNLEIIRALDEAGAFERLHNLLNPSAPETHADADAEQAA